MRTFDPWVGSKCWTEGLSGVRVLILGESHYDDPGTENHSFTIEVVRKWAQEKRHRFFTVTQKLVLGLGSNDWVSNEQRNFVQSFPGAKPRQRPTQEMWSAATIPFLDTVQELKPQVLIVLGYELQRYLPVTPTGIRVCGVQHPSSRGFQYEQWQPAIRSALQSAAQTCATQQDGLAAEPER